MILCVEMRNRTKDKIVHSVEFFIIENAVNGLLRLNFRRKYKSLFYVIQDNPFNFASAIHLYPTEYLTPKILPQFEDRK